MSQSRNMRGLIATSHGRMALVLWSGLAVVLGCGFGLAAEEAKRRALLPRMLPLRLRLET